MKKRLVSLLLALALLVLPVLPAFAAEEDPYTYVALGDSITTGVGLKDTHFSSTAKSYDVQENYHGYSKDCYVARVADALGLDRDHAVNYGMPAAMSSNILDLVRTGSTASGVAYYDLPTYGRHFRLLNRSVKALAQQYGADYVSIPYTSIANDGHPTVCGHKYIARQILKAVRK